MTPRRRPTQKQRIEHLVWALERVSLVTVIPADKRHDLDYLRSAVVLAHSYAQAGVALPESFDGQQAP